jgi:hypothetical protein
MYLFDHKDNRNSKNKSKMKAVGFEPTRVSSVVFVDLKLPP